MANLELSRDTILLHFSDMANLEFSYGYHLPTVIFRAQYERRTSVDKSCRF